MAVRTRGADPSGNNTKPRGSGDRTEEFPHNFTDAVFFTTGSILKQESCVIEDSKVMSLSMWVLIAQEDFNPLGQHTVMSFGPRPMAIEFSPGSGSPQTFNNPNPGGPVFTFGPSRVLISGSTVVVRLFDRNGLQVSQADFVVKPRVVKPGNTSGPFVLGQWNLIQFAVNTDSNIAIIGHQYAIPSQTADLRYNGNVAYSQVQVWFDNVISFDAASVQSRFSITNLNRLIPPVKEDRPGVYTVDPDAAQLRFGRSDIYFSGGAETDSFTLFRTNQGIGGPFVQSGFVTNYNPGPYGS